MTIEEYFGDWMRVIDKKELVKVSKIIGKINDEILCPLRANIFKAFELCKYNDLKLVFIGQDVYPSKDLKKPRATGILFGNSNDISEDSLSPSLKIIKDCVIDFSIPHNIVNFDNSLESWAKQGILMINSALTCELNKIGSHIMIWRPFIASLVRNISYKESGIIYVLFGKQAQTFKPYINKRYNEIIEIEHPSYFARTGKQMPNVFKEIDKLLIGRYGETIKWFNEHL